MATIAFGSFEASNKMIAGKWILLFLATISLAETFISPMAQSFVTDLVPKQIKGLFSGINQMLIGVSGVISGHFVSIFLMAGNSTGLSAHAHYSQVFSIVAGIVLTLALITAVVSRV